MRQLAPVALFAFNRPEHLARAIESLRNNPEANSTHLHIFVDGARSISEQPMVEQVAKVAEAAEGFAAVHIYRSEANKGLYTSITQGVNKILAESGRIIVVEDDLVVSAAFLRYMNEGLSLYEGSGQVACIHGYAPPIKGAPDYFLLPGADCWGWATWRDSWQLFRSDTTAMIWEMIASRRLQRFVDIFGYHSIAHLVRRALGRNQSWASDWHASLFLANRLTLHPGRSFVMNIGNDGTGTHSATSSMYATSLAADQLPLHECEPRIDTQAAKKLRDFLEARDTESALGALRRKTTTLFLMGLAAAIGLYHRLSYR